MNSVLTYGKKLDWGYKALAPKYVKAYGFVVFLLGCGHLWIFHVHHASAICQLSMGAVVAAVGLSLAWQFRKETGEAQSFWISYQVAFIVLMGLSLLLRSW